MLAQELRSQEFVADTSDWLCRAAFYQHYPTRHRVRATSVSFLLSRDLAHRRVRFTEVRADDILMLNEPGQDQLGQPSAQLPVASWLRTELDSGYASTDALAHACRYATGRAGSVPPQREELATPRGWVVEPGQVGRGAERRDRYRLIEGEVAG